VQRLEIGLNVYVRMLGIMLEVSFRYSALTHLILTSPNYHLMSKIYTFKVSISKIFPTLNALKIYEEKIKEITNVWVVLYVIKNHVNFRALSNVQGDTTVLYNSAQ
jgi:hypothetical protein